MHSGFAVACGFETARASTGFGEATLPIRACSGFEVASEQPFRAHSGFKVASEQPFDHIAHSGFEMLAEQPFRAHSGFEVAPVRGFRAAISST